VSSRVFWFIFFGARRPRACAIHTRRASRHRTTDALPLLVFSSAHNCFSNSSRFRKTVNSFFDMRARRVIFFVTPGVRRGRFSEPYFKPHMRVPLPWLKSRVDFSMLEAHCCCDGKFTGSLLFWCVFKMRKIETAKCTRSSLHGFSILKLAFPVVRVN
jgi:hypothetical protein